jgi:hypothetical protein
VSRAADRDQNRAPFPICTQWTAEDAGGATYEHGGGTYEIRGDE